MPKILRIDEQERSVQLAGRVRAVQVEKMHLPKPGNRPSTSEQYCCHAVDNPSKETTPESIQI